METATQTFDKAYKKDKIGKAINSEYKAIKEALSTKKDFNSDF